MSAYRKCVIWDLDNTLWDGVCLEGNVSVKPKVLNTICELDKRGILHSIASRGDEGTAMKVLVENELEKYFLVPKINWLPKSQNISSISKELDISLDSIAFVDDDEFEREQIEFMLPGVLTIDAELAEQIPFQSDFSSGVVTKEASNRRLLYQTERERKKSEKTFNTREDFLLSCRMKLTTRFATELDIPRILELMTRTHQLNTTGLIFSNNYVADLILSEVEKTKILVAELKDKFGEYGIIGTAITVESATEWILKYLAISCRVMGRGIERAFLYTMMMNAYNSGLKFGIAEFRPTGKNKLMRTLFQMTGFELNSKTNNSKILKFKKSLKSLPDFPKWVELI